MSEKGCVSFGTGFLCCVKERFLFIYNYIFAMSILFVVTLVRNPLSLLCENENKNGDECGSKAGDGFLRGGHVMCRVGTYLWPFLEARWSGVCGNVCRVNVLFL